MDKFIGGVDEVVARNDLAHHLYIARAGWLMVLMGKSTLNSDGSLTVPASIVEGWMSDCSTDFVAVPESKRLSLYREADAILLTLRQG